MQLMKISKKGERRCRENSRKEQALSTQKREEENGLRLQKNLSRGENLPYQLVPLEVIKGGGSEVIHKRKEEEKKRKIERYIF